MINICASIFFMLLLIVPAMCQDPENQRQELSTQNAKSILEEKLKNELNDQLPIKEAFISFDYKDKPLTTVIQDLAAYKGINVILPQGAQALTMTVNYSLQEKLTIDQAWEELNRILDLAGYSWLAIQNDQLQLVKIDKDGTKREILPLFVNPKPEQLPDTGNVIQTIFYLSNLKLSDNGSDQLATRILKGSEGQDGMLSINADVKVIKDQNALVITDKSENIKAAMKIILAMDVAGIPDAIEVVPLYYVQADYVENIFKELIPQAPITPVVGQPKEEKAQATYFPIGTKVLALKRTNSIVIMGSMRAIRIVKDFIIKYMDHMLESGRSILHIYNLQYLDAEDFAPRLDKLVKSGSITGQAQTQEAIGPRKDFRNVIIVPEPTKQSTQVIQPEGTTGGEGAQAISQGVQQGGNRLIIAAQWQDWLRIEAFIKKVDKPNLQVAIEVLVVDLSLFGDQQLGSQMRNPEGFADAFNNNINFQTANLDSPILRPAEFDAQNIENLPANALMANLLPFVSTTEPNLASNSPIGTTVITLSDPNSTIWNVWRILNEYTDSRLLAQPFITTLNNQQANITSSSQRFLIGGPAAEAGAVDIKNEWVTADIAINILPRVSLKDGNINLQVAVKIEQFTAVAESGNNTRTTRLVDTDANLRDKEVLAIGGLMQEQSAVQVNETPLLGKIPILGWFFKNKLKTRQINNLMVFISPTIIMPRNSNGMGHYTQGKICLAEQELEGYVNFQNLRDPITRWFFQPDTGYAKRVTNEFVEQAEFPTTIVGKPMHKIPVKPFVQNNNTPEKKTVLVQNTTDNEQRKATQLRQMLSDTDNPLQTASQTNQPVIHT